MHSFDLMCACRARDTWQIDSSRVRSRGLYEIMRRHGVRLFDGVKVSLTRALRVPTTAQNIHSRLVIIVFFSVI